MNTIKRILCSPVTQFNLLVFGFFILIGAVHNHAHHTMEVDADSYVRQWCNKNPDQCARFIDDEY